MNREAEEFFEISGGPDEGGRATPHALRVMHKAVVFERPPEIKLEHVRVELTDDGAVVSVRLFRLQFCRLLRSSMY